MHTIIIVFSYVFIHDTCRIIMCTKICSEIIRKYFNIQDNSSKYYTVLKTIVKYFLGKLKVLMTKMRRSVAQLTPMNCLHDKIQPDTVLAIQFTMRRGIFFFFCNEKKPNLRFFFFFFAVHRLFFGFQKESLYEKTQKKRQNKSGSNILRFLLNHLWESFVGVRILFFFAVHRLFFWFLEGKLVRKNNKKKAK